MIIDSTYFTGEIIIKGLHSGNGTPSATDSAIRGDLDTFIYKYEPLYLENMFGSEIHEELDIYLKGRNAFSVKIDKMEKILSFLTINGFSPIANYVYFYYVRSRQSISSPIGVEKEIDKSVITDMISKSVIAWNGMVSMNRRIADYMSKNTKTYPFWSCKDFMLMNINEYGL